MLRARLLWGLVPAVAVVELLLQAHLFSSRPAPRDLRNAAAVVREGFREGDLVVVKPPWLVQARRDLGSEVMPRSDQARPDEATYRRFWELSTQSSGTPLARSLSLDLESTFGSVTLRRYSQEPRAEVLMDFVERIDDVMVSAIKGGRRRRCERIENRWRCDQRVREEWVGTETISDLDHQPRRCIWAHPLSGSRLRIEFDDVPRGESIEGHTATDYVVGRYCSTNPVEFTIEIDGEEIRTLRHYDCESWRPFSVTVPPGPDMAEVAFVVSALDPSQRHFCFQAQMRRAL